MKAEKKTIIVQKPVEEQVIVLTLSKKEAEIIASLTKYVSGYNNTRKIIDKIGDEIEALISVDHSKYFYSGNIDSRTHSECII